MSLGEARFEGFTWRPLGRKAPVVEDLDLTIAAGERVLLVGPSGSGKSTMLMGLAGALGGAIAGDLSGSVGVDGRLGLLMQNPADALVAERMGRDVAFGLENVATPREQMWRRVDEALDAVGLAPYGRDHLTAALSGGEQQRLALAGTLALAPDVLLLDEPTSMLDDRTASTVRDAVLAAVGARTLIVVEHRIGPWLDHVDRVVVLAPGGSIASDTDVATFRAAPAPRGVWAPGMTPPVPLDVPADLVAPDGPGPTVRARDVSVELVLKTLRGSQRTRALTDVSLTLEPGRVAAFVGRSGAGKSTAIAMLAGLVSTCSGTVTPDLRALASTELAAVCGWVPQNPEHGFLTAAAADEVALTAHRLGRPVDVGALLDVFGLGRFAASNPYRLSGGEQRRLAMAAALAHRPGLVLLDEPTVGQDPDTWAAVAGWIAATRDAGATIAVSTHDPDLPRDVDHLVEDGRLV